MNSKLLQSYNNLCEYAKEITGIDITKVGRIRRKEYVRIRASIIVSMLKYLGASTVDMGEIMGLDHTTIIHHRNNHKGRYRSDDEYLYTYDSISKYLVRISDNKDNVELGSVLNLIKSTLSG